MGGAGLGLEAEGGEGGRHAGFGGPGVVHVVAAPVAGGGDGRAGHALAALEAGGLVVDGAEGVHGPGKGLGAERGGHLAGPVVVGGVGAVEGLGVCEGLHQPVSEPALEVGSRRRSRVHRVPLPLPPLSPPVLEPDLQHTSLNS